MTNSCYFPATLGSRHAVLSCWSSQMPPEQPCPLPALPLSFSCPNPTCCFLVAWCLVFIGDYYFQLLDWVYTRPFLLALHLFSKTSASTQKIIFLWVLTEGKVQEVLSRWAAWWTLHEKSFGFNHPFPPRMPLLSRCWELIACLRIFFFCSDNLQGVVVCFGFS